MIWLLLFLQDYSDYHALSYKLHIFITSWPLSWYTCTCIHIPIIKEQLKGMEGKKFKTVCPLFLAREIDKNKNKFLTGTHQTFGIETYNSLDNSHIHLYNPADRERSYVCQTLTCTYINISCWTGILFESINKQIAVS